ncbi:MAG: hypothetical protein HYZ27_08995, partial [Deltaproteobacteria bacterium]|nr:hypothetical protein [Deltaproteobacteria bacterium]
MRATSLALVSGFIAVVSVACNDEHEQVAADSTASAEASGDSSTTSAPADSAGPNVTSNATAPAETSAETTFSEVADTSPLGGDRPAA